jgi:uncharacterized membrane protein (UPF0127 family)
MKKYFLIITIIIVVLATFTLIIKNNISSEPVLGLADQLKIGNNTWAVEIANTDETRISGLSNQKILYPKKGMLFVFDKMGNHVFWMKDMFISLDMIFFDDNWRIVEIDNNLEPNTFPKTFGATVKSQYVLEINAGEAETYGLKVTDQAFFFSK